VVKGSALILTNGWLKEHYAKTAHGLLRGSDRFEILGVIDPVFAGKTAGEVLRENNLTIPVFAHVNEAVKQLSRKPQYCIIGVAVHGGKMPESFRPQVVEAIKSGISIVSGLHSYLSDDAEFRELANSYGVNLVDVRKPRPIEELRFWTGDIYSLKIPRIAMLGMDCVIGKRTTGRLLMEMCNRNGIKTELIYTGQTGWMQGLKFGFIFDATVNDFISGEIEGAILQCAREAQPDLILVEGQSSLRNPSGPCGAEFILSGDCRGVILQHAPGRLHFDGLEKLNCKIPSVSSEIELIANYGARTLAITLNETNMLSDELELYRKNLQEQLGIPVIRPLKQPMDPLLPVIGDFMKL
jgi:uncharacterized NAD-dependent epimerase/dehydratase family protein